MAPWRAVTVALDGYGAEQGFDVLARRRAAGRRRRDRRARLRAAARARARRRRGDRGRRHRRADRQRGGPGPGGAGEEGGLGRPRRRATSPRAARRALVSCGSTGATMAAATFGLRRLKGVQRPALAVQLPVPGKPVLFLDVGANVEVRAQHLVQFAFLGAAFSAAVLERRGSRGRPAHGRRGVGQGARGGGRGAPAAQQGARDPTSPATSRAATCRPPRSTSSSPTASPATSP